MLKNQPNKSDPVVQPTKPTNGKQEERTNAKAANSSHHTDGNGLRAGLLLLFCVGVLALLPLWWINRNAKQRSEIDRKNQIVDGLKQANRLEAELAVESINQNIKHRNWTAIVFHHSATDGGSAAAIDRVHRKKRGWPSLGYHFVIGNGNGQDDGSISVGPRWKKQQAGIHANNNEFNNHGIGVCLVGNFEESKPTDAQLQSTYSLVQLLAQKYNIPKDRLFGHNDVRKGGGTLCPGKLFPLNRMKEAVQ